VFVESVKPAPFGWYRAAEFRAMLMKGIPCFASALDPTNPLALENSSSIYFQPGRLVGFFPDSRAT
jgi:hypothetical protein